MKINQNICIESDKVILVPYLASHVPHYHKWMSDPKIRELTASEELTVDEEYANQISWREDELKLTFIIVDKTREIHSMAGDAIDSQTKRALAGDCNLFFHSQYNEEFIEELKEKKHPLASKIDPQNAYNVGEIEIMIAEPESRGKGLAKESLKLLMVYAVQNLNTAKFIAKIGEENGESRNLFKKLNYDQVGEPNVFNEVAMELVIDQEKSEWNQQLRTQEYSTFPSEQNNGQ